MTFTYLLASLSFTKRKYRHFPPRMASSHEIKKSEALDFMHDSY